MALNAGSSELREAIDELQRYQMALTQISDDIMSASNKSRNSMQGDTNITLITNSLDIRVKQIQEIIPGIQKLASQLSGQLSTLEAQTSRNMED